MKNTSGNSQKLLLGLVVALLVATAVQTTALVYIGANMGTASSPVVSTTALPDMAGGC